MRNIGRHALGLVVVLLAAGVAAVAGDDPTPAPTPVATTSTKPTPMVITNETVSKYSGAGHVTEVTTPTPAPGAGGGKGGAHHPFPWEESGAGGQGAAPAAPSGDAARDEAEQRRYWRGLYEQQLELLRSIHAQIDTLDREIPGLWRDFYARDDPMYRDGVIKPKLDEALDRRQRLEERLGEEQQRLPEILERARKAGSKPGWFRGLEQPTPSPGGKDKDRSVEPEDLGGVSVVDPDHT